MTQYYFNSLGCKERMRILSWNVNGLRSILSKGLCDVVNETSPDVVCLQETKIQDEQVELITEKLPRGRWCHSAAEKKGYSGVATISGEKKSVRLDLHAKGIAKKQFDSEGRFLVSKHAKFTLYNMYFPSGTSGDLRQKFKYSFLDAFHEHLSRLPKAERDRLIICGDFNICHKDIDIHHPREAEKRGLTGFLPEERQWMDRFCELGFVDTFRLVNGQIPSQYTWWSFRSGARKKNLGWRIDYIFVSHELASKVKDAKILHAVPGSDHCPVVLDIKL